MSASAELTDLLNAARSGDSGAADQAYDLVYAELRERAGQSLRRMPGATLTPTALVHEVYLRFNDHQGKPLRDRSHFFALAARAMRQIVIDHARQPHAHQARRRTRDTLEFDTGSISADTIRAARSKSTRAEARSSSATTISRD